nr:hypothetical protein BaRGS_035120 [Batillaria attramentaria]
MDVLQELSIRVNFSYLLMESSDTSYGVKLDNGQWDGLIGMLTRKVNYVEIHSVVLESPSRAGRVLVCAWLLLGVVLVSVYSSKLTATLAVTDQALPFSSMAELVNQDTYSWGIEDRDVLYLQKGSPFTNIISKKLDQIVNAGLVTHWKRKWTPAKPPHCNQDGGQASRTIQLAEVQTAFYLAGAGVGLAVLTLGLESLLRRDMNST